MDSIILNYRNPLLSVMIIVAIIFFISFFTYSYSFYKERIARRDYRKLLRRFELGNLKEKDYVHLYKTYNLPFDSILLLASSFLKKGNFNKAINVYLTLLDLVNDKTKKEELLELLGKTYYRGGFLVRAKEIFLRILKFSPRNIKALKYLVFIDEKLNNFDEALEAALCLEELDENMKNDIALINSLKLLNDAILDIDKKTLFLHRAFKENKIIQRVFVSFLIEQNKKFLWEHIEEFDCENLSDLFWYLPKDEVDLNKIQKNTFLEELYNAKGYLNNLKSCNDFELNILILLRDQNKQNASLNFEFICTNCKNSHPVYDTRCPHCHNALSFEEKHHITKGFYEKNQSLQ